MRRAALATGAVAATLAVGLALGWWRSGGSEARPALPISFSTRLSTQTLSFGDPLTARLDVVVDPRSVDPESVRVRPRFAPYRVVRASREVRSGAGMLLSYRYALECLVPACLPGRTLAERRFLPAAVAYRRRGGARRSDTVDWPVYRVASRLTTPDFGDPTSRLRVGTALPTVSYRISPGTLEALLAAAGAVLVLVAAGLAAAMLPPRRRRVEGARLSGLQQALLLVRSSGTNGFPAERRQALGRLARELGASGRGELAATAFRLAWSAEPPTAEAASSFAERVESSL